MIILPECLDDDVSNALRDLTRRISKNNPELEVGGFLGGGDGYGCDYEDSIFMMHNFCWCDQITCPWCVGCDCYKDHTCDWCNNINHHAEKGALGPDKSPHLGAPNFWHKETGIRIWWHKYIGRDMVIYDSKDNSKEVNITKIIKECFR